MIVEPNRVSNISDVIDAVEARYGDREPWHRGAVEACRSIRAAVSDETASPRQDRAPGIVETTVELYLGRDAPDDWALIDDLDADEVREVAKKALDIAVRCSAALQRIRGNEAVRYFCPGAVIEAERALHPISGDSGSSQEAPKA